MIAEIAKIEIEYGKALSQASKIEKIAEDIERQSVASFDENLARLSTKWKGNVANSFLSKGMKMKEKIGASAEDLRIIAGDIRRTAKRLRDADIKAAMIASTKR